MRDEDDHAMRDEDDFSEAVKTPYVSGAGQKRQITVTLDRETLAPLRNEAARLGISCQSLISRCLARHARGEGRTAARPGPA